MRSRLIALLAVGAALALAAPVVALADDDPAGGALLGQSVFFPYHAPSVALERRLNDELASVTQRGLPLKVAIIASPADLGGRRDLFGHPQRYAEYLELEVGFQQAQPLLVVMAAGYGVDAIPTAAAATLAALAKPAGGSPNELVHAAMAAVARLGFAVRHPQKPPGSRTNADSARVAPSVAADGADGAAEGVTAGSGGVAAAPIAGVLAAVALSMCVAGALLVRRRRHPTA